MRRKILTFIGVLLLFIVVFVLAIFWALPTESIRHLAEKTIEKQFKQEQSVEIEDLSISPLLNVTIKKFQMRPRNPEPIAENLRTAGGEFEGFWCAPYVEEQPFVIDKIFINPSVFKLIKKKPQGRFELDILDGKIKGELKSKGNLLEVSAAAQDISMNEFVLLSNLTKMQIYGNLEFDTRAVLEGSRLADVELELTAANTAICPKRLKLNTPSLPYFELPFTVFGNINATISVEKDKLKIHKLVSDGPDIKLDVKGSVTMKSPTNDLPRFDIEADITPSAEWMEANKMKAIYQLCEKLDDGSIHLSLTGTSKKPKIDCGTPIPEPVEETVPAEGENAAGDAKLADAAGADSKADADKKPTDDVKKVEEKPAEEQKRADVAVPVRPEREDVEVGDDIKKSFDVEGRDTRLKLPNRPNMPRGNRAERPAGARGSRPDRGLNGSVELRGTEKLDENARRELRRRNRQGGGSDNNDN